MGAVVDCKQTDARRLSRAAAGVADDRHKVISKFLRMDMAKFQLLLNRTAPLIARTDSNMRQCISLEERIALTLRCLATGEP